MTTPSERELFRLFEHSPIGMSRSTAAGRFTYVNPALARMLGYTVDELLALDLGRDLYWNPAERPALIAELRARGVFDGVRAELRTKHGERRIVRIFAHLVAGSTDTFDASIVDITDSEASREELAKTAATLELAVGLLPAIYWRVDRDLRVLRFGGVAEQILGISRERYLGRTLPELHAAGDISQISLDAHHRALGGETVQFESELRERSYLTTIAPTYAMNTIDGAIGASIDVTATRALERRMADAERAESLGVFAGGLAHDFGNLLVAILGNVDLGLRDNDARTPARLALENIRAAASRAADLTDQLLAYAGHSVTTRSRVELSGVVDELVRISASSLPPNVSVTVDIDPNLAVLGDPSQIRRVVLNLLVNARDALTATGGHISFTARRVMWSGAPTADDVITPPAGTLIELVVTDDGPGVSSATRGRMFEPFFTTKTTGHGLGLSSVLGIVRSHGGGLRLTSSLGAGARFAVLLPVADPIEPVAPPAVRRSVLVIDDEELVRDVVTRMVEDLGYTAVAAHDGTRGLELAASRPFDAAIVDLTLPGMHGADVIRELRARYGKLRIVLCSGYDRDRQGPVDADVYLPKPFRIEALERALAKALG